MAIRRGDETIWGEADSVSPLPGIPAWHVETPSHGGYAVEEDWAEGHLSPALFAALGNPAEFGHYWFEEDCDWCLPVLDSPAFAAAAAAEWFATSPMKDEARLDRLMDLALDTAGRWQGGYLAATGRS